LAKNNVLTQGKKLKADTAAREGRLEEARTLFQHVCQLNPSDAEAWVKLGLVQKRLGRFDDAETSARRAILLAPKVGYCHHALGVVLHSKGRNDEAIVAYRKAIALQPDFSDAHYLLACALHESGNLVEAIGSYRQALALRPDFPEALGDLGALFLDIGELSQGAELLARALVLQPANSAALNNMSNALRLQGKVEEAFAHYRHALCLTPDSPDVTVGLANLLEKSGELAEADELVQRTLAKLPMHPGAVLLAAQLARREKRYQEAAGLLESLRSQPMRLDMAGDVELALGQIYDQLDNPELAYPLIVSGNAKKARLSLLGESGGESYLARVALISSFATPALARCEHDETKIPSDYPAPVFLIGFPRSGTTLLEQILDSHPGIVAMEEKGAVATMVNAFLAISNGQPGALAELNDETIAQLRQIYFREAKNHVDIRPDTLLLDKMPLNTVVVPIIWRVFPEARFILAIRHPCDASLSCLMQNFAANEAMANFSSLEKTARTYATVMEAWRKYIDLLPIVYHRIRYEDLISDVEGESRRLLAFLDIAWDGVVLNHTEHARKRGAINTPSYHQVTQPIYQHAKYRWKRYERDLLPVMGILQPFISYFGYDEVAQPGSLAE
jgi:Flp pilus assembly protein TadD